MKSSGRLPNFLYLGPDKSGSTWLHSRLSTHPQVYLSPAKDLYFFDQYFDRGLDWYRAAFREADDSHVVVGEICHSYLYSGEARQRIIETLPDVRLMVCLREPLDHLISFYLYGVRSGSLHGSFRQFVDTNPDLLGAEHYAAYLEPYINEVGRERMYVGVFNDLRDDPQSYLNQITDWLQISRHDLSVDEQAPVLAASEPRVGPIGMIAHRGAGVARKLGLERTVGKVKLSRRVQRALYRPVNSERVQVEPADVERVRSQLGADVARLTELCGIDFARRWGWD